MVDLACGPGTQLAQLAQLCPAADFVGVDLSAAMLAAARQHVERLRLGNVRLEEGDITDIDLPGRRIDLLVAEDVLTERRRGWRRREPRLAAGFLSLYAERVGPADRGAVLR